MNQENSIVNNEVTVLSDADFESSVLQSNKPVLVGKLDVDANPVTTAKYGIRGIPALVLFKDGEPVHRITGVKPKQEIIASIEALL